MIFENLPDDILLTIMTYLPINNLISINKQLFSLHTEQYYKLYSQKYYFNKAFKAYQTVCKKQFKNNKICIFEILLKKYNNTILSFESKSQCQDLIIYIFDNIKWVVDINYDNVFKSKNKFGKYTFELCYSKNGLFKGISIYWKDLREVIGASGNKYLICEDKFIKIFQKNNIEYLNIEYVTDKMWESINNNK